ncbi:hypothetical protein FRC12_016186 [Ceratobasidium sp. 428]|nr:hypothetical protein FRC12_016186 [Ceratobasidium sp. 428]
MFVHFLTLLFPKDSTNNSLRLLAFVRNDKDIESVITEQSSVLALMTTIQEMLRNQQLGKEEQTALRGGLNILYDKTDILPPLTDCKYPLS